jgi:hypothetical protein
VIALAYAIAAILGGFMISAALAGKPVSQALDEIQKEDATEPRKARF